MPSLKLNFAEKKQSRSSHLPCEKGFQVSGIDISETAIRTAKQRAKKSKAKIKFLVGNAYDLKFRSSSFNFVFDRGCFHHIPPWFRVLVKKGKYLLLC